MPAGVSRSGGPVSPRGVWGLDPALAEGLPAAARGTHQASHPHSQHHPPSVDRHVGHRPQVKAVHPPRRRAAHRTDRGALPSPCPHHDPLALVGHILYDQRGETRKHRLHKLVDILHASVEDLHDSPSPPNVRQGRSPYRPLHADPLLAGGGGGRACRRRQADVHRHTTADDRPSLARNVVRSEGGGGPATVFGQPDVPPVPIGPRHRGHLRADGRSAIRRRCRRVAGRRCCAPVPVSRCGSRRTASSGPRPRGRGRDGRPDTGPGRTRPPGGQAEAVRR